MLKNIVPRTPEEITEYAIEFMHDECGGLSFDCDENGKLNPMRPEAKANYDYAMSHPEEYPYCFNKFVKRTRTYMNPAHGTCSCGTEVSLVNEYRGACECPTCGRWYNLFGQQLIDPEGWEEDYDY